MNLVMPLVVLLLIMFAIILVIATDATQYTHFLFKVRSEKYLAY